MEIVPKLPERPPELVELQARRAELRAEREGIESELTRLQTDAWNERQANDDPLDAAAERLALGEVEATSRDALPEQAEILRSRLDLLQRAESKVGQKITALCEQRNRQAARALRPAHRAAAQRIYRALVELVAANEAEEKLRASAPGLPIRPATFPCVGHFGPRGEPAQVWKNYAIREGLIDEGDPEARFPAAAL